MNLLLKFGYFDFFLIDFLEFEGIFFFQFIEVINEIGILFHFSLDIKILALENFLISSGDLHQGLLQVYEMAVDLFGSVIL
jgi:hypothetical protein